MMPRFASFSRKQQQVWAVVCLAYGIWLLVFAWNSRQQDILTTPLTNPDPPERQFYLEPLVNPNTATAEELQLLPGIGPVLARRIVQYRDMHGYFSELDELDAVFGIGPKTIQKLHYYCMFE